MGTEWCWRLHGHVYTGSGRGGVCLLYGGRTSAEDLVARRAAYSRRRRPAGKVQENQRAIDVCKGPDPGNAL